MVKIKALIGSIIEIKLKDGSYAYSQLLDNAVAYFQLNPKELLTGLDKLKGAPILFIADTHYDKALESGRWKIAGHMEIRDSLKKLPMQYVQDPINPDKFRLYNPNTGELIDSSQKECSDLERAAVWSPEHIEDRLLSNLKGKTSIWQES